MPEAHFETFTELMNCHSRIGKKLEHHLGAIHGLGVNEFLVLYHLETFENAMSRIKLAERIGLTASGVTRLLRPMEKLGLIEKQTNKRDARLSLVKLSEAGTAKLKDARRSFEEVMASVLESVSSQDQANLVSIISKIQ